ncbi:unnamed protein product [Symbiodinium sp. CCMP2456]|nr:unnamed protein product [Symbiodinium sp. CCMP2456]
MLSAQVLAYLVLPRYVEDQEAEEVQHCIASAAAIVVGLAWDKAFESLTVHMTRGWDGHYVIAKAIGFVSSTYTPAPAVLL